MTEFQIREMTPTDVDAAVEMYRSGGWGERRPFIEKVIANASCRPLVGIRDGAVVATGLATINGTVGWVGSIFVDPSLRRQGLGQAMTDAVCERLDAAGCTTQALIASEYGRPMYEKMGFRIAGWYQILEALPRDDAPIPPRGTTVRAIEPRDMDRVGDLDCRATGEARRALLEPLAPAGWLLESDEDLLGFLIPILDNTAAVVAPDHEDAAFLLELLRHLGRGKARTVQAAAVKGHEAGLLMLERRGWNATFETPRMLRGEPIDWEPALIWSILGFAFG